MTDIPQMVKDAILMASDPVPEDSVEVRGYDFGNDVNYRALLDSYRTSGFQATHFGRAVDEVNEMVRPYKFSPGHYCACVLVAASSEEHVHSFGPVFVSIWRAHTSHQCWLGSIPRFGVMRC